MAGRPSVKNYIGAFFGHWSQSVSGGAGLIATAGALGIGEDQNTRLILGVAAALAFIFAAYRVWAFERAARNRAERRVSDLESEYPHALRLDNVDCNMGHHMDPKSRKKKVLERELQFQLHMKNCISRPVEYRMDELWINSTATLLGNGGEIVSGHALAKFQSQSIRLAPQNPLVPDVFYLEMIYRYGEPGNLSRKVRKKMRVLLDTTNNRTNYVNELDEDLPCQ